ncbi:MAG: FtsB family cell division protein [Nitrospirales bacterium]
MSKNRKRKKKAPGFCGELMSKLPVVAGMILSGVFLGYIFFTDNGVPLYLQTVADAKELEYRIQKIQKNTEFLEREILRVQSDPLKLEELARNRLGMVRKGERVYQFLEPRLNQSQSMP